MSRRIRRYSVCFVFISTLWTVPHSVYAGELSILPEQGAYTVGEEFQIQVVANTGADLVSAVEAELAFDPKTLIVHSISTEGSALSLWSKSPVFSNTTGTIQFSGWAQKNFKGTEQLLLILTVSLTRAASSGLVFNSGAMLSGGVNTLISMKGGAYSAEARSVPATPAPLEEIVPATHAEEVQYIEPPVFTEVPALLQEGERIILRGTTLPNARVFVWTKENESPAFRVDIVSAADGTFTYVSDRGARAGTSFEIWAEAQTVQQGIQSGESVHIVLKTPLSGLAAAIALSDIPINPLYGWTTLILLATLGVVWLCLHWKRETE